MIPYDQTQIGQAVTSADDDGGKLRPRYSVDTDVAGSRDRSLPTLIARRRCFICRQADEGESSVKSDAQQYLECIAEHCGRTPDYLLPDTPLKEAIFKVILAGNNQPLTAEEISHVLSEKWAMTPFPRDISPSIIQRLLDHSESYCIAKIREPEEEENPPEHPSESPSQDAS